MNGPDVRWDGVPHHQIVEWVSKGPGASLTSELEAGLKSAAEALAFTSDVVNSAIQKAGGDWQGGAADSAMNAMRVLRSFDDGMFFTSNQAGVRAFGQSDGSSFVRANVPPVVDTGPPPQLTGSLLDIVEASADYQHQQSAAKQAEQRARDVMQQYTDATVERAAAMTPLTPAPQVILDIGSGPVTPQSDGAPGRPDDLRARAV